MSLKAINLRVAGDPGKKGLRHLAIDRAMELGLTGFLNYTAGTSVLFIHIEGNEINTLLFCDFITGFCKQYDLTCDIYYATKLNCNTFLIVHDPENYNPSIPNQTKQAGDHKAGVFFEHAAIDVKPSNRIFKMLASGYNGIRRGMKHTGLF